MIDRKYLPVCSFAHVLSVIFAASFLGTRVSQSTAYASVFVIYWISCWIMILLFRSKKSIDRNTRKAIPFLNYLSLLPVLIVAYVALDRSLELPTFTFATLVLGIALVNGFTEEMYWRKIHADLFPSDVFRGLIWPWFLFTVWHFALLLIPDIVYEGGALALIGGSALLGGLWGVSYWFNRNFLVIASAHILSNTFAFFMFAHDNAWVLE